MPRALHRFADAYVRWNRLSWLSEFGAYSRIRVSTRGVVIAGNNSGTNVTANVFLPRGDYRFYIVGGGGGGAYKYTKGTVAAYKTDYFKVSSGKYSMAGGGSGASAVIDIHLAKGETVAVTAGTAGSLSANSTTKASNGGNSSISIASLGITVTCGGGGGGKANDGSTGTVGAAGTFSKSGSGFIVVYSGSGKAGTRKYLTGWNTYEAPWPEGIGGMFSDADNGRILTFSRTGMSKVLAIPQTYKSNLYGTHYGTFVSFDSVSNSNTSFYMFPLAHGSDPTFPAGDHNCLPMGCGGTASLFSWDGTITFDGTRKGGAGMVAIERTSK